MRDPVFVPWFLEQFERRLPNHAPSVKIDDASHFLQDDRPDRIVPVIRAFMQSSAQKPEARVAPAQIATGG